MSEKYRTDTPLSHSTRYHTRPDCQHIKSEATEVTKGQIEWHDLEPCAHCHGTADDMGENDHTHYNAAKNHD